MSQSFIKHCVALSVRQHTFRALLFGGIPYCQNEEIQFLNWVAEKFGDEFSSVNHEMTQTIHLPDMARIRNMLKKQAAK